MEGSVRIARGAKAATDLARLGVHPRVAKAVGAMIAANLEGISTLSEPLLKDALSKAASSPTLDLLLKEAAESASSVLCHDLGTHWVKAAKGGGGGEMGMTKEEEEEDARADEREVAEQTVKVGYSVARTLGFDPHTSLFAACYAFTKL